MAVKGKGVRFFIHDGADPGALVEVGEVLGVTPPSPTRDTIDTTHHGSAGDYREFISSLIDAGEVSVSMHYIPGSAEDTLINAAFAAGDLRAFKIGVNSDTPGTQRQITGSGFVTGYVPDEIPIDDKMVATLTLKVSGPIAFGAFVP